MNMDDTSCEFSMNDCITTTKQSKTKPCAYFLGYTVYLALLALCDRNPPIALGFYPHGVRFILLCCWSEHTAEQIFGLPIM